jgi:hypothetical protein
MKHAILGMAMLLTVSGVRASSPAASSAEDAKAPTKDLVSAAKDAKGKRKQPSTKAITNADVKKSKGKLIVLSSNEAKAPEAAKEVDPLTPLQRHDANHRERLLVDEKIQAAQARVDELEKELLDVELRYYEENDPDRRDRIIRVKFEETRKALEEARSELDAIKPKEQEPGT